MGPSKRQAVVADAATSEAPAAAGGNADDRWAPAAVAHTTYNCRNSHTLSRTCWAQRVKHHDAKPLLQFVLAAGWG